MDRFVALSLLEDLQFPPPPTHPLEVGSHQGNAYLRKVLEGPPVATPTPTKSNKGSNDGYLSAGKEDADGVEEKPKSRQARAKAILHLAAVAQRLGKRWSDAEVVPYLLRCCEDDDEVIGLAVAAVVPALAGKSPLEFPTEVSSSSTKLPETGGFKGQGAAVFLHQSNGDVSQQRDSDLNLKMAGVCATSHSSILSPLPSLVAVNVVAKQARLPRPSTTTPHEESITQQHPHGISVVVVSPEALVPVILALSGMSSARVRKYVADVTIPMLCFGVPFSATYDNAYYNYSQFQASRGVEMEPSSSSSSSHIDPFTSNSQRRRIVELIQGARSEMMASSSSEVEGANAGGATSSSPQKLFLNILSFLLVGCTSGEACSWGTEAFGDDAKDNERMVELFRKWRWQHSSYSLWSLGCDDEEDVSDDEDPENGEEDTPSNPLCVAAGLRTIANLLSLLAEGATSTSTLSSQSNDNKHTTSSEKLLSDTKDLYTPYYPKEEARLLSIGFFSDTTLFNRGFVEQVLLISHVVAFEPNTGSGLSGRAALNMLVDERGSMIANPSTNPSGTSDPFCNYFGAGPTTDDQHSGSAPSTPKTLSRYVFGPFALLEVLRMLPSLAVLSTTCPDRVPPQLRVSPLDVASILFTVCAMPEPTPPSQSEVPPPITLRPPTSSLANTANNGPPVSLSKSQVNLLQSVRRTFSVDPCRESIDGASTLLPNPHPPTSRASSSSHSNPKRVMLYRSRSAAGNNHLIAAGAIQCVCSVLRQLTRHIDADDTLLLLAALRYAVLEPLSQHISWRSRYVLAEGLPSLVGAIAVALGGSDSGGLIQSLLHIANPALSRGGASSPSSQPFEGGNVDKQLHISRRTTHTLHGSIVSILHIVRSLTDPRTETEDEVRAVALSVISMPGHSSSPHQIPTTSSTTLSLLLTGYDAGSSAPPDMVMALLVLVDFLKAAHAASNVLTSTSSSDLQRISPKVIIQPAAVASDLLDIARQVAEGRPNLPVPTSMGASSPTGTMIDAETSLVAAALAMSEVHRERVKGHVPALVVRLADLASRGGSSALMCIPSVTALCRTGLIESPHPTILFTSISLVDPASSDPNWLRTECAAILADLAQEPSAVVQMSLANALLRQRGASTNSTPTSQWSLKRRLTPNHELLLHIARNLINSDTWRVRQHFCDTAVLLWVEAVGPALAACGEVLSSLVNSRTAHTSEVLTMLNPLVATLAALQCHTVSDPSFLPSTSSSTPPTNPTAPYFLTTALHISTSISADARPADVARDIFTPLEQQPGQISFHNTVRSLLAYKEVDGAQLWTNFEFGMTWWLKVWVALLFDGVQSVRSAATAAMGTAVGKLLTSSGDAKRANSHRASNLLISILVNCDVTQVVMSSPMAMTKFHNRVTVLRLLTTLPQVHRRYIVEPLLGAFSRDPITNVRMAVSKSILDLLMTTTTASTSESTTQVHSDNHHQLLRLLVVESVGCRLGAALDMDAITTLLKGLVGDASKDVRDLAAVAYAKVPIRY